MSDNKENVSKVSTMANVNGESCLFVTEDNRFDICIKYNEENGKIFIDKIDPEFKEGNGTKSIVMSLKYPSHGDYENIIRVGGKLSEEKESMDVRDILRLEFVRLLTLARKWSLRKPLNNENIMSLQPRIVKAMMISIREQIGIDGMI